MVSGSVTEQEDADETGACHGDGGVPKIQKQLRKPIQIRRSD